MSCNFFFDCRTSGGERGEQEEIRYWRKNVIVRGLKIVTHRVATLSFKHAHCSKVYFASKYWVKFLITTEIIDIINEIKKGLVSSSHFVQLQSSHQRRFSFHNHFNMHCNLQFLYGKYLLGHLCANICFNKWNTLKLVFSWRM